MTDDERKHLDTLTQHFGPTSASLLYGAVHRVRWTLADALAARSQWGDGGMRETVAWVTSPAALGADPIDGVVAFTTEDAMVTTHLDGSGPTWRSALDPDLVGVFERREKSAWTPLFTPPDEVMARRGMSAVAPAGWLVSGGAETGVVEVMLGLSFGSKKSRPPRGARVLGLGGLRIGGVQLARVTLGPERWAPLDLSGIGGAIGRVEALWKTEVQPLLFVAPDPVVLDEGGSAKAPKKVAKRADVSRGSRRR